MARPKRIGAFSALDDSLAGPVAAWLSGERIPHPVQVGRAAKQPQRRGGFNVLDELLPGPQDEPPPPAQADVAAPPRPRRRRQTGRNALDDLLPGPDTGAPAAPPPTRRGRSHTRNGDRPRKVWVNFEVPADVMSAVADAVSALSGPPVWMTMADLAERALRTEIDRLADEHNGGRPFPPQRQ